MLSPKNIELVTKIAVTAPVFAGIIPKFWKTTNTTAPTDIRQRQSRTSVDTFTASDIDLRLPGDSQVLPLDKNVSSAKLPFSLWPINLLMAQASSLTTLQFSQLIPDILKHNSLPPNLCYLSIAQPNVAKFDAYAWLQKHSPSSRVLLSRTDELQENATTRVELLSDDGLSVEEELDRVYPGKVILNTWPVDVIKGNVGHAALYVPAIDGHDAKYISHWPLSGCTKGAKVPATSNTYEEDCLAEQGKPNMSELQLNDLKALHQYLESEEAPLFYALDRSDAPNCVDRVMTVLEDGAGLQLDPSTYSLGDGPLDRMVQAHAGKVTPNALKHSVQSEQRYKKFEQMFNRKWDAFQQSDRVSDLDSLHQENTNAHKEAPTSPSSKKI